MKKNGVNGNHFKFILYFGVVIIVYALGFMDVTRDGNGSVVNFDLLSIRQNLVIVGSALFLGGLIGGLIPSSQTISKDDSNSRVDSNENVDANEQNQKQFLFDKVSVKVSDKRMLLINLTLLSVALIVISISIDVSLLFLFISFFTAVTPFFISKKIKNIEVSKIEELIWLASTFVSCFLLVIKLIPFVIGVFA